MPRVHYITVRVCIFLLSGEEKWERGHNSHLRAKRILRERCRKKKKRKNTANKSWCKACASHPNINMTIKSSEFDPKQKK